MYQNYPNPFNNTTTIQFDLPFYSKVDVAIYNLLGKKVKQLIKNEYKIGSQKIIWNGKNDNEFVVASGLYFYVIKSDSDSFSKKMLLLR